MIFNRYNQVRERKKCPISNLFTKKYDIIYLLLLKKDTSESVGKTVFLQCLLINCFELH